MEYGNAANPFNQRFILRTVQAKVDDFHATSLEARNVFLYAHANCVNFTIGKNGCAVFVLLDHANGNARVGINLATKGVRNNFRSLSSGTPERVDSPARGLAHEQGSRPTDNAVNQLIHLFQSHGPGIGKSLTTSEALFESVKFGGGGGVVTIEELGSERKGRCLGLHVVVNGANVVHAALSLNQGAVNAGDAAHNVELFGMGVYHTCGLGIAGVVVTKSDTRERLLYIVGVGVAVHVHEGKAFQHRGGAGESFNHTALQGVLDQFASFSKSKHMILPQIVPMCHHGNGRKIAVVIGSLCRGPLAVRACGGGRGIEKPLVAGISQPLHFFSRGQVGDKGAHVLRHFTAQLINNTGKRFLSGLALGVHFLKAAVRHGLPIVPIIGGGGCAVLAVVHRFLGLFAIFGGVAVVLGLHIYSPFLRQGGEI